MDKKMGMTHEICVTESKYINSEDSRVEVSFALPGRDWYELSESQCWKAVESFLQQNKEEIMSINISAEQAETFKNYLMRRAELTAEETGYDPAFILDGYIETLEDADGLDWERRSDPLQQIDDTCREQDY